MGPPLSGKPREPSPKSVHKWTPEPTNISDPLFDKDFDEFMESLNNLEPYDDLEDWSENVDLFMDAMSHSPHMANILWMEAERITPSIPKHRQPVKKVFMLQLACRLSSCPDTDYILLVPPFTITRWPHQKTLLQPFTSPPSVVQRTPNGH